MRIACVGGGPAGLYFAVQMALQDERHEITVYERNPAGVTYGWGVGSSELLTPFETQDPPTAERVAADAFLWSGELVGRQGRGAVERGGDRVDGYCIGRQHLIDILSDRARELGVRVENDREIDPTALAAQVDLVVAADGLQSRFRQQHAAELGAHVTTGRNKYVWLGTTKVFRRFTFSFVETAAGWLWCHAYGYSDERSTFIVECSPETWRGLGLDSLGVDESLKLLEDAFSELLEGHPLLVQVRDEGVMPWLNFRTVRCDRWHVGNVALMGDAAHTTHFSIGSGTLLALGDALGLADALARHTNLAEALEEYGASRRAAVRLAQREASYSARWLEEVARYMPGDARRFGDLHRWRRSPFLAHMPPAAYYLLRRGLDENRLLRSVWGRVTSARRSRFLRRYAR